MSASEIDPAMIERPKRRWPRFSLRSLLIVVACAAVGFAGLAALERRAAREYDLIQDVQAAGGRVFLERRGPEWLGRVVPDRYRRVAVGVTFSLAEDEALVNACLERLWGFDDLRLLDLDCVTLSPAAFAGLAKLTNLRTLYLNHTGTNDEDLAHLSQLDSLEVLNLADCEISDDGLKALENLVNLKSLDLTDFLDDEIKGPGLAYLSKLPRLQTLDLSYCGLNGSELEGLGRLTKLEALYLHATSVGDDVAEHLARLTRLKVLDLIGTQVSEAGLAKLATLTELEDLGLDDGALTGAMLLRVRQFPRLKQLHVSSPRGVFVAGSEQLEWLEVTRKNGNEVYFGVRPGEMQACRDALGELWVVLPELAVDNYRPMPSDSRGRPGQRQIIAPELFPAPPDSTGGGQF